MAERKARATREETLKAKIENNLEAQAKLVAKIEALKEIENGFRKELDDLKNARRKLKKRKRRKQRKQRKRSRIRNCLRRSTRPASALMR